jgi:phosphatidylglycerophosphate synthase
MPEPISKYNSDCIFYFFATKIAKYLNINPNIVTYLTFILSTIIFKVLLNKKVYLTLFLVFVRSFMDILDGCIARYHKRTSDYGHKLDLIADNYFNIGCSVVFSYMLFNSSINLLIKIIAFVLVWYIVGDTGIKELSYVFNNKPINYDTDVLYIFLNDNTILVYQVMFLLFFSIIL